MVEKSETVHSCRLADVRKHVCKIRWPSVLQVSHEILTHFYFISTLYISATLIGQCPV